MDDAKLLTELADARYDAAIRRGSNNTTLKLLLDPSPGSPVWRDISIDDFYEVADEETFSNPDQAKADRYTARDMVPTSRASVEAWIRGAFSPAGIAAIDALATYQPSIGEAATGSTPTLRDVRRIVRRMAKSHIVASGQAALET